MELLTFVKIEGYEKYFLLLKSGEELSEEWIEMLHTRLENRVVDGIHGVNPDYVERVKFFMKTVPNYNQLAEQAHLLIQPIGSYMTLRDFNMVEKIIYGFDFPTADDDAEIVICENDALAEPEWVAYLNAHFPNEKIKVLNFFNSRPVELIKENFKNVRAITFSTTFTNFDWFQKMLEASNGQQILGYCHNPEKWTEITEEIEKYGIAVVESL